MAEPEAMVGAVVQPEEVALLYRRLDEMTQAMSAAHQQLQQATQANAALLEQLTVLQSQTTTADPPPAPAAEPCASAKPQKPPVFQGKFNDRPDTWLFMCRQYFEACNMPPERRVVFASSFLRDHAATWWRIQVEATDAGRRTAIASWEEFSAELTAHFQRPDLVKSVRDQLANLKQQRSVHEYTAKMRELSVQVPDMSEEELLDRYVRGLKDSIRREVELRFPFTLDVAIKYAERTEQVDFRLRNNNQGNSRGRPTSGPAAGNNWPPHRQASKNQVSQASSSSGPAPMEIGNIDATNSGQPRQGVVCYSCGKTGHIKRNCPNKGSLKVKRQ